LSTFDKIKTEALLIELKIEDKKKTSTNGDSSSPVLSSQAHAIERQNTTDQADKVDDIKGKGKPGNKPQ
jgi:hypothetical protein